MADVGQRRSTNDLRPRSTSALVISRSDTAPLPAAPATPSRLEQLRGWLPLRRPATAGPQDAEPARWPTVLIWIVLGAVIAALWALLLLGDSLAPAVR